MKKIIPGFTIVLALLVLVYMGLSSGSLNSSEPEGKAASTAPGEFAKPENVLKACHSNQKLLLGALHMFQLDHQKKIVIHSAADIQMLVDQKYLNQMPNDPECGGPEMYQSDEVGNLWCIIHGSLPGREIKKGGRLTLKAASGTKKCATSH